MAYSSSYGTTVAVLVPSVGMVPALVLLRHMFVCSYGRVSGFGP